MTAEEYIETVVQQAIYVAIDKLCTPLHSILTKLAKYDLGEGFLHTIKMLVRLCTCIYTHCRLIRYRIPDFSYSTIIKDYKVFYIPAF